MKSTKTPTYETASSITDKQTTLNKNAAYNTYNLNATNQSNPYGTLTYEQTGTWADGTPKYEAKWTRSSEQQNLYNLQTANQASIGQAAQGLLTNYDYSKPFTYNENAVDSIYNAGSKRLNTRYAGEREALETSLRNKGITQGSDAWAAEWRNQYENENDAYNQLWLNARNQDYNEQQNTYNTNQNTLKTLQSLYGYTDPTSSWINTPNVSVNAADYTTAASNENTRKYNTWKTKYDANTATNNAILSGVFGLGSAAAGGWATGAFK